MKIGSYLVTLRVTGGTEPSSVAISIARMMRGRLLASPPVLFMVFARWGSSLVSVAKSSVVSSVASSLRSFLFGGTSGKTMPSISAVI